MHGPTCICWDNLIPFSLEAGGCAEAFRLSWVDGRRSWITKDELTSFVWSSRMKASAGERRAISDRTASQGSSAPLYQVSYHDQ